MILLTGATGYVGGELLRALEGEGRSLRCLARRPESLRSRVGLGTEVIRGDLLRPETLGPALEGVRCAFYLVHSMDASAGFEELDRRAARGFAEAARTAGLARIVYLGGLGDASRGLSAHLRSRQEVGDLLRGSGATVVELRASIVIGCGSLSFEMIRALVERLPVMMTPRWVATPAQPIGIDDLLAYLIAAIDLPLEESRIFEIGGAQVLSYGDLMQAYAGRRGLRRWMIPVPILTPRLSSLWLGLVTPYYARVGRRLVGSLRNPTVVSDGSALRAFRVAPAGAGQAIDRALESEERLFATTPWSRLILRATRARGTGGVLFGTRIVDHRATDAPVPPADLFAAIERIGGRRGYYYGDVLWRLRGWIDRLVGGIGFGRGRRDPERLVVGDAVDFWRVEALEPGRRLRLAAEMKVPGRAWLEFEVEPREGGARLHQTAVFAPKGLLGILYWYSLYLLHGLVFRGTMAGLVREARSTRRRGGGSAAR